MTRLTFYGGVGEVGGNKILLEDGKSRLFLDFGISYHRRALYFEEFLNPRPGAGLTDVLEMGLLPPLAGLYRSDLTPDPGLWERYRSRVGYRELASVDAVLLSHAHLDHSGHLSFLMPDVPIYASAMTAFVAKAIQDTAPSDIEREVCYANLRQVSDGYLATARGQGYRQRPFVFVDGRPPTVEAAAFWAWSPTKSRSMVGAPPAAAMGEVAGLKMRAFPVDHSIYGATAYAVATGAGWLVYSGDLRLHGGTGHLTQRFAEQAAELRPTVLVCEGTRAGESRRVTEDEVFEHCLGAVKAADGLVVADFGPRNVERLLSFYRVAQATSRALVVLAKDAYLLDAMRLASDDVPDIARSTDLMIYDDLRAHDEQWRAVIRERHGSHFVGPKAIQRSPGDYILCFSFWDVNDLIDIGPTGGSYIYSSSEAYDEEAKFDLKRLRNWIEHFGMKSVGLPLEMASGRWEVPADQQGFHASGHASGPELIDIIRAIRPKMLIPVHTERPEAFVAALRDSGIEVRPPQCALDAPWPECAIELG